MVLAAVAAVWSELRRKPSAKEATQELFARYVATYPQLRELMHEVAADQQ